MPSGPVERAVLLGFPDNWGEDSSAEFYKSTCISPSHFKFPHVFTICYLICFGSFVSLSKYKSCYCHFEEVWENKKKMMALKFLSSWLAHPDVLLYVSLSESPVHVKYFWPSSLTPWSFLSHFTSFSLSQSLKSCIPTQTKTLLHEIFSTSPRSGWSSVLHNPRLLFSRCLLSTEVGAPRRQSAWQTEFTSSGHRRQGMHQF